MVAPYRRHVPCTFVDCTVLEGTRMACAEPKEARGGRRGGAAAAVRCREALSRYRHDGIPQVGMTWLLLCSYAYTYQSHLNILCADTRSVLCGMADTLLSSASCISRCGDHLPSFWRLSCYVNWVNHRHLNCPSPFGSLSVRLKRHKTLCQWPGHLALRRWGRGARHSRQAFGLSVQ